MLTAFLSRSSHETRVSTARRKLRRAAESARPRCGLESLEDRRLMSVGVSVDSGVLNINGTDAAELVVVNPRLNPANPYDTSSVTAWSVTTKDETGVYTTTTIDNVASIKSIVINGRGGDDTLRVSDLITVGARIDGGAGNDYIAGGGGADNIIAGGGTDVVYGQSGNDLIDGGDGIAQDFLLNSGNDSLDGGRGNDRIYGSRWGLNKLTGGIGDDSLFGGVNNDNMEGGSGRDYMFGYEGNNVMNGGTENDTVLGGNGADVMWGGEGDDLMDGQGGNDQLGADAGNDTVSGGDGNDIMYGGVGNDFMLGGAGNDDFNGEAGNDSLSGGDGNDTLHGGADNDALHGDAGADRAWGGDGVDTLSGVCGEDVLSGGAGNDVLEATFNLATFFRNRGKSIAAAGEYANAANGQDTLKLKLDLGSAIRDVLKPIVGKVQEVTRVLDPIVKLYDTKVPVLSYFDSSWTYGKIIDPSGRFNTFKNAVKDINALTIVEQNGLIDYGSFSLSSGSNVQRLSLASPFQYIPDFQGTLDKLNKLGLAFPILNDTANAAKLALGHNLDLFTFTLPDINLPFGKSWGMAVPGLGYTVPSWVPYVGGKSIGVTATVGFNGSFKVGGKVGVDMLGVQTGNLLDGFYAMSNTGASLTLGVTATGSLDVWLAKGSVTGNLNATVSTFVRDTNRDGKSRLSEMATGSTPFEFSMGGDYSLKGELVVRPISVDYYFGSYTVWGGYKAGGTFASGKFSLV